MQRATAIFGVMAVFGSGMFIGNLHDHDKTVVKHDTAIIKVPDTHVEHDTRTKTVYVKLPSSCASLVKLSERQVEHAGAVSDNAGKIQDDLSSVGSEIAKNNVTLVYSIIARINSSSHKLDD